MGRTLKYILIAAGGLFALLIVGGITFMLLVDPNDFREKIAGSVQEATGRELVIEGDLSLSIFPWLAVEIGKSQLGNAEGFGDEPFASFDSASLSVRLMPLILRREVVVGAAAIDALALNLEVAANGKTNWQDFSEQAGDEQAADEAKAAAPGGTLDIAGIDINNASLHYRNAQLNEQYTLSNLNVKTGSVRAGEPIDVSAGFDFEAQPADSSGRVELETVVAFESEAATIRLDDFTINVSADGISEVPTEVSLNAPAIVLKTEERTADFGAIAVSMLDLDVTADIDEFSYADAPKPRAKISIAAFSPRSLMNTLNIEVPATADPSALGKLMINADAALGDKQITLSNLELVLDETNFSGELIVPRNAGGTYRLDLAADNIDLNRYMAPADESAAGNAQNDAAPVEIPAELIRTINARGNLRLASATMGNMQFDDVVVTINSLNDKLRVHPISAKIFGGTYNGDIRIDASKSVPVLSVNEQINGVSLKSLGQAMFERDKLSGTIEGSFQLSGRGDNMGQVQQTLNGTMNFTLSDGAWEGRDVWYELRRARALFRKETPPEPVLPARTPFSEVRATGVVTDGILKNDDFFAALPFMQLTGNGTVNMPAATVDYSLSGRVFDQPESVGEVSAAELDDFTKAVIPLKITGPLAEPKFAIDFEELLKERVREEIEDQLKDKLQDLFRR